MHRRRGREGDTETGRQGVRGTNRGLDNERHGVEKKSPVTNIDTKKNEKRKDARVWDGRRTETMRQQKLKLIIFGAGLAISQQKLIQNGIMLA